MVPMQFVLCDVARTTLYPKTQGTTKLGREREDFAVHWRG